MENGSMRTKVLVIGLALALALLAAQSPIALAQDQTASATGTWESVKGIPLGEKLEVKLKNGKTVKGTLRSVSDTGLSLGRGSDTVSIGRDEVRRVYHAIGKSSGKPALVGALVGAAIGAGGTAVSAVTDDKDGVSPGAALLPLVGAGTGALIGLAFGRREKRILIYESQ